MGEKAQEKDEQDLSNERKILVLCVLYIILGEMCMLMQVLSC